MNNILDKIEKKIIIIIMVMIFFQAVLQFFTFFVLGHFAILKIFFQKFFVMFFKSKLSKYLSIL